MEVVVMSESKAAEARAILIMTDGILARSDGQSSRLPEWFFGDGQVN
jgi:hypothetical protein